MTISELIERLSKFAPDAEVTLEGDYYGGGATLSLDSEDPVEPIWYSPGTQY